MLNFIRKNKTPRHCMSQGCKISNIMLNGLLFDRYKYLERFRPAFVVCGQRFKRYGAFVCTDVFKRINTKRWRYSRHGLDKGERDTAIKSIISYGSNEARNRYRRQACGEIKNTVSYACYSIWNFY